MFSVNVDGKNYKVSFHHVTRKNENSHRTPLKTFCFIKSEGEVVADGLAKPVEEVAVLVPSKDFARERYRRHLRKIYPLKNGEFVAILRGDNFDYESGRKTSLEKALLQFSRENRALFWDGYNDMLKKARETSKKSLVKKTNK